jgi:hypothetical protein
VDCRGPPMMFPRRDASPRADAPAALRRRLRHGLKPRLTAVLQFTAHPLFTPKHHSASCRAGERGRIVQNIKLISFDQPMRVAIEVLRRELEQLSVFQGFHLMH